MAQPLARVALVFAVVLALAGGGCTRQDKAIGQHREKLESLGATTLAIGEAWLAGDVSGTYTRTALEETFQRVEKERSALAQAPQALLDPRGAELSQAAEHLSRLLAVLIGDIRAADATAARQHLAQIPILPSEQP